MNKSSAFFLFELTILDYEISKNSKKKRKIRGSIINIDKLAMVYIIMGVSGCGKTTVGKILAEKFAMKFYDADDFHSENSIKKMQNLIPLEDEDRIPWLLNLAVRIRQWNKGEGAVLACSALKEKYRQILSGDGKEKVIFIYLEGDSNTILERMKKRKEHFFAPELLESQFSVLEEPSDAVRVPINKTPEEIGGEIIEKLAGF